MPFDEVLRARVEGELKARFNRLLRQPEHRGRNEGDLLRIACEDYCTAEEKRLRIKPITPEEVEEMAHLLAAERTGAPYYKPHPQKNVSYSKGKRPPRRN